ncbi:atrial natriuretic peptide receptor 2-like [Paramacrobiotus metropolitanus]|uniref:atrial natriuretic peptide receptor 2-like n=1 Tax=Paramacrobiotus metropolitanus TaxID=2943436 RepID=UPI0024461222|nr:atrial natriuretic peptide receptor 2-like [Paramacrobiotus metropolitanus]
MSSSEIVESGNFSLPCPDVYIKVFTLTILYPTMLGSLPYLGPAFDLSFERIKTVYPNLHFQQTMIADSTYRDCTDWGADSVNHTAPHLFREIYDVHRNACMATMLIFPGCDDMVQILPVLTELNLLMITSVATLPILRNKILTPTWIGMTANSFYIYIRLFDNLCALFNWHTLGFLVDKSFDTGMAIFGVQLSKIFSRVGFQPYLELYNSKEGVDRVAILNRLNAKARIYFFFGESGEFRQILKTAAGLNMTMGEHVYVIGTPFRLSTAPGYLSWNKGDADDAIVRQAYRSVLIVEADESVYGKTKSSGTFSQEIINRSRLDYNYTYRPFQPISPHPAATYASMMIIAQVMEELRISGNVEIWSSGRKLAKRLMNRTFSTDVGDIYIDPVGERNPQACVNQLTWNTSEIRTLLVQTVPDFVLRWSNQTAVEWPGPWPPPNEPRCGFRGDNPKCSTGMERVIRIY